MKELIRMNQIAGTITESQARKMLAILNEGIYIAINKKPTPEMQAQIAKAANKKFFVDEEEIKFKDNPKTGEYSVFIPSAGDYSNMMSVLKKFGIKERPYTSPSLR